MLSVTGALTLGCAASVAQLAAATPAAAPMVTYTASGTFGGVKSGSDLFQLQGQAFSISIVASEADVAKTHGPQWAGYNALKMTGTVQSGLLPTPLAISNNSTSIELAVGNPSYDVFVLYAPIKVIGITLTISANLNLSKTTLTNDHILPFAAVALPATATMSYSDGTNATVLYLKGNLVAKASVPSTTKTNVVLHDRGARIITAHGDGTESVRAISAEAIDLGVSSDKVALQFYASGVRDGAEVEVRIGGKSVPLLYAGAAERFAELDEITVAVPHEMAGMGDAEVSLTVDGQMAEPVHVRIQ
jgi:hypothetical protein